MDPPSITDDCGSFEVTPSGDTPADVEILAGPPEEDASSLGGTEVSAAGPPQSLGSGGGLAESASSLLPSTTAATAAAGAGTPMGHVFCLRCPYCRLSTIRWPKFLRHQVTCPVVGSGNFFHRLYFCSECLAVSTERQLLQDHISAEHVGVSWERRCTWNRCPWDTCRHGDFCVVFRILGAKSQALKNCALSSFFD